MLTNIRTFIDEDRIYFGVDHMVGRVNLITYKVTSRYIVKVNGKEINYLFEGARGALFANYKDGSIVELPTNNLCNVSVYYTVVE